MKPVLNSVQANQNLSLSVSQPNKTSGQSLSVDVECSPDLALSVHPPASSNNQTLSVSSPMSLSVPVPKSLSVIPKSSNIHKRNIPRRNIRKPAKFSDYV